MKNNIISSILCLGLWILPLSTLAQDRMDHNVVYGMYSGLALVMDVYYPETSNNRGIVLVPGSGWHSPADVYSAEPLKAGYGYINQVRDTLLYHGFTVFVPNHRAAPRFTYPAAVTDLRRAVRFIRYHADRFDIDPDQIGGLGHSSGAHLVGMLGVEHGAGIPEETDPVAKASSKLQAVVTVAAPFDLSAFRGGQGLATVVSFMGERPAPDYEHRGKFLRQGRYAEASPVSHVSSDDASFLVIQGDQDQVVPADQAEIMVAALRASGLTVRSILVEGGDHAPVLDHGLIARWLKAHLDL